ncbi:MAG: Fic family protein [Candidatus Omnitrophica bacterium]|nr:Fic family protein [Candidatus Omnitrophota bacterium]
MKYIWQHDSWPHFTWKSDPLLPLISHARLEQGKLISQLSGLGLGLNRQAQAEVLIEEAVKTSAIEGERLNRESVRSSVARRLGLSHAGLPAPSRAVDGLVEALLEATQNYNKPLTAHRLKRWQAALFPTGYSGLSRIRVGKWRGSHPVRVVLGAVGHEKIHFEAPPGERVKKEMKAFLSWWGSTKGKEDGLLRAGLAHFYFVTIHPFEDGNGRIARALTDMALAQDEKLATRYYSLSSQIMEERNDYYEILERSQKGHGDLTEWLQWFFECHIRAVDGASKLVGDVLSRSAFWQAHDTATINERQRKIVNRLLDAGKGGFQGGLTTRKYVSMAKTSRATAFREISDLVKKGVLCQKPAKGGRSVSYDLNWRVKRF